jgi:hypothetical protein
LDVTIFGVGLDGFFVVLGLVVLGLVVAGVDRDGVVVVVCGIVDETAGRPGMVRAKSAGGEDPGASLNGRLEPPVADLP